MTRERGGPHEGYMRFENILGRSRRARLAGTILRPISVQPEAGERAGGRQKSASTHAARGGALNDP